MSTISSIRSIPFSPRSKASYLNAKSVYNDYEAAKLSIVGLTAQAWYLFCESKLQTDLAERNLQLMPFEEMKDLQTLEQMYEGDNFDLFWELPKTLEKTQEIGQIKSKNKAFRHKIALIVSSLFTIFIFIGTNRIPEHNCR